MREHGLGALILAELDEGGHVETDARHRNGGVDRAAADVGGNLHRLGLAPFLEQQERVVGVQHRHALDAVVGDDGDGVDHRAADGEGLHGAPPAAGGHWALASPVKNSSISGSHNRTPPVTPAALATILACSGSSNAILRALPPPI